ncbi:hypothetical protein CDL15_Pgr026634 [Punica granatum]|uniref:Flavonoid 3',5'-hydroxylase 2-like n=1 Tax=Punica granatum TaxID=22663 RepID=A0A218WL65_PUNGR|nr:hypothetical protein CDL15_Pgr026634 [Punica granatum]
MAPLIPIIDKLPSREIVLAVLLLFIARFSHSYLFRNRRPLRLPAGPKGWPIVGALPLLGDKPHEALAKMAKQYGPVMYLRMGTADMVTASTPSAAQAFLKTLDANFSSRPKITAARVTYDAEDMVFANYGPSWKLLRKLSSLHLLGGKAIEDWTWVREQEVGHILQAMCGISSRGKPVVMPEMLSCRFNIGDYIQYVRWMDLQGIERKMKRLHEKFDALLNEMIEQHVGTAHQRVGKPDFLDMLMADKVNSRDKRPSLINIKGLLECHRMGTCRVVSILNRALEEMDKVIGRERRLYESDLPKLPYLQALCKEILRKHPSTPLIPRLAAEDCQVHGYDIPRGTRLAVNVWAIGRDPETWENPLEFMPERFLNTGKSAGISPWGNDFELILFGAGRRICAGMRFGMLLVEYILGTLVHAFDWNLPNGAYELNMDETFGLTLQKAVPLSAIVSPRLSPSAYVPYPI